MAVCLMLCILTLLVSVASAAPEKGNFRGSVSLYEYAGVHVTSSDGEPSCGAFAAYTGLGTNRKGLTVEGATQAYVSGGPGSSVYSGQILSGDLS